MVRLPTLTEVVLKSKVQSRSESKGTAGVRGKAPLSLQDAAAALSSEDLQAIRTVHNPPVAVRRICEALYLITLPLSSTRTPPHRIEWSKVRSLLTSQDLHELILNYDIDKLRAAPLICAYVRAEYLGHSLKSEKLTAPRVRNASRSAGLVFDWIVALFEEEGQASRCLSPSLQRASTPSLTRVSTPSLEMISTPSLSRVSTPSLARVSTPSLTRASTPCVTRASTPTATERMSPWSPAGGCIASTPPSTFISDASNTLQRNTFRTRFRRQSLPACGDAGIRDEQQLMQRLQLRLCTSDPTLQSPTTNSASSKHVVVLAGTSRGTLRIVAQRLLNSRPDSVLVLALHGEDACEAIRTTFVEEAAFLLDRIEFEPINTDNAFMAREAAARVLARHPKIDNLVIDAKAFRELPGAMAMVLRRCDAVFRVFRPHLTAEARVVAISCLAGVTATCQISEAQRSLLFSDVPQRLEDLVGAGRAFTDQVTAARRAGLTLPCQSPAGWWLDLDDFPFMLVNALVYHWQKKHTDMCICACGCVQGARPDAEEAQTVLTLLDKSRTASSMAGQLFTNFGSPVPWVPVLEKCRIMRSLHSIS